MARAEAQRERIGDMLVAAGLVTTAQLDEALTAQRASQLPLGKQLVVLGYVTEVQLTQLLSNQLSVPWVSLDRVEFSTDLLSRIPGELADSYTVMPVYVRSVRGQGHTLYVAMDDPTDERALRRVSVAAGLPVKPMIASPSDIRRAIEEHYFGGAAAPALDAHVEDESGLREVLERAAEFLERTSVEAAEPKSPSRTPRRPPPPPAAARGARTDGVVALEQYETPSQPPTDKSRTLTFLDGTQVALPTAGAKRISQDISEVRHVIKAVRAASAHLGVEEPLRWHDLLQSMLDALQARNVRLTRKEIAEAWARHKAPRRESAGEQKR